jgi:SAM-dependent methyltransferase
MTTTHIVTPSSTPPSWATYLNDANLFDNAIRLRNLIWTIQRHVPKGGRILEVGCGSGATAVLLSEIGYQVTAVDREEELIVRIRERYSDWIRSRNLEVLLGDMFALPWDGQEFDLIYHQGVLEHFEDEQIVKALTEQRRVASRLIFDVPNARYPSHPYGNERLLRPSHWRKLLQQAGWELSRELGRDFHPGLYALPYLLFSRTALEKVPWFSKYLAVSSIFVCRENGKHA